MAKKRDPRLRIVVSASTNSDTREFGIRTLVSKWFVKYDYTGTPFVEDFEGEMTVRHDLVVNGFDLVRILYAVEGVQFIESDRYQVYVTIGTAFDWDGKDGVERRVVVAIKGYLLAQISGNSLINDIGKRSEEPPKE
ncbi:MAG: hypothetical protein KGI60_00730 [Patescibacteria group bacterium]|nr:hypothetical protein [Patescibacteria group bacterium]